MKTNKNLFICPRKYSILLFQKPFAELLSPVLEKDGTERERDRVGFYWICDFYFVYYLPSAFTYLLRVLPTNTKQNWPNDNDAVIKSEEEE